MRCSIAEMRSKEVINIMTGFRLGFVSDVELDLADGRLIAVIVPGPAKFLGLFGREDDYVIPWEKISRIGDDIILVDAESEQRRYRRDRRRHS